jgi:hypothetical protein
MPDPFHEPKSVLASLRREYTEVGSLNSVAAFGALVACEGTVGALYREATGKSFPYKNHTQHKPGRWVNSLGVGEYYSSETLQFLTKLDSYALEKARYEGTPAYCQYISESASEHSRVIVEGTERFINETQRLTTAPEIVKRLRSVSSSS